MSQVKQLNLQIVRATNGWVVTTLNPQTLGYSEMFVVPEDGDLAGSIAAALISQKLTMADSQSKEQALLIEQRKQYPGVMAGSKIWNAQNQLLGNKLP